MAVQHLCPAEDWRNRVTLTVKEAAEVLGVARNTCYEAVHRGEIPTIRIGNRLLIPVAGLRRLLGEVDEPEAAA